MSFRPKNFRCGEGYGAKITRVGHSGGKFRLQLKVTDHDVTAPADPNTAFAADETIRITHLNPIYIHASGNRVA